MLYHSTRSKEEKVKSKKAILTGLCPDGGLYVSDDILNSSLDMESLIKLSYEDIAFRVFSLLLDDYSEDELKNAVDNAYKGKFETRELTPVSKIGDKYLLELYHGPTAAFKDMALCMLPKLMSKALNGKKVMILTATSGDTGKAALAGFRDAENIGITVFYPYGKVSDIQRLQMETAEGKNTAVAAVKGNFDDCQSEVKHIFAIDSVKTESDYNISLSSANSINVGRLVPQIVYYIYAYKRMVEMGELKYGERIDFVVPTGNFGDVLAGYYAKLLGLPIGKLVVASNENRVLTDFLRTGLYDKKREFVKTISPSMDILVSSNLERMLYYASGCDEAYVKELMEELSTKGEFRVNEKTLSYLQDTFDCGFATNEESKATIRDAFNRDGRLIDPHTACGLKVAGELSTHNKQVILSTASPFKFAADVYEAVFGKLEGEADGFKYMEALSAKTGEKAPEVLMGLREKKILHGNVIEKAEMESFVMNNLSKA